MIIDYSTHRYKNTSLVFTEILGLLGGLFTLYLKITQFIGKLILKFLYYNKKKERQRLILEMKNREYVKKISLINFDNDPLLFDKPIRKISSESCIAYSKISLFRIF